MRHWLRWVWCALRDHPYPRRWNDSAAYRSWLDGELLDRPTLLCGNCGAAISGARRGMHS